MTLREVNMRDTWFWKVAAASALIVAAFYVTAPLWAPAGSRGAGYVDASGGATGGVIAYPQRVSTQEKVFILDTKSKAILIYTVDKASFRFVAGRPYGFDVGGCLKSRMKELPYNSRGYKSSEMKLGSQLNR